MSQLSNLDHISISEHYSASIFRIIAVSISHLAIGIGSIAMGTFIPAQFAILNWNPSIIAYLLGIATFFEIFRLLIGYFADSKSIFGSFRRNYVIIGLIFQILGLLLISRLLGSFLILFGMISFTMGTATVATITDAYLIDISLPESRARIGAILQIFRISGFATGGIMGVVLFDQLKFSLFFNFIAIISLFIGLIAIIAIQESVSYQPQIRKSVDFSFKDVYSKLRNESKSRAFQGMTIFLVIFLIGAFAQDAILEPYAIFILKFNESNIGRLPAIWGTTTLIFLPIAIVMEKKIGRMTTIVIGSIISSLGMTGVILSGISTLSISEAQLIFLFSLGIFGMGLGIITTPSTAYMLEICALSSSRTLVLAFFGLITTIARSIAIFTSGIILELTNDSFFFIFIIESGLLLISFIPLILVHNSMNQSKS